MRFKSFLIVSLIAISSVRCDTTQNLQLHEFPEIVVNIKKSVAYVQVATDLKDIYRKGTAFVLDTFNNLALLATARHIIKDTGYYDGIKFTTNTDQIEIKFENLDTILKGQLFLEREDRDIAILIVKISTEQREKAQIGPVTIGKLQEINEGVEIGCTGYELSLTEEKFGEIYLWPITRRGIISSVRLVGPAGEEPFLNNFQCDIQLQEGGSGSPIYLSKDGKVIGVFTSYRGFEKSGLRVNYGLAECQPIWSIVRLLSNWAEQHENKTNNK